MLVRERLGSTHAIFVQINMKNLIKWKKTKNVRTVFDEVYEAQKILLWETERFDQKVTNLLTHPRSTCYHFLLQTVNRNRRRSIELIQPVL